MESFIVRYRNLLVLLVLLAVQIVGLAVQVHRSGSGQMSLDPRDSGGVRLIRLWANALVSPPEQLIHSSRNGIVGVWQNYIDLRHVRRQNKDLTQTIDRLRLEQAALLEDARQGERLQALLHFQEKYIYKTLAAEVIGSSGSQQSHVVYIDKGEDDGLHRDMAVITPDGIVGKIREVYPHTAQVLMINDQTSGAGVILETTRIRGILRGNANGQPEVVGILSDNRIQPGEHVLTAGGDLIFPRGLPVGTVEKVVQDPDRDAFIDIILKPAARLNSLDEVLVITSTEPHFPPDEKQDMAESRAVDGAVVAAAQAEKKASEVQEERLPSLMVPNLPPDQQPLNDSTPPNPIAKQPPQPLHPDQFSPSTFTGSEPAAPQTAPQTAAPQPKAKKPKPKTGPSAASTANPPRRNP
ncbi:MAG TPA: rod shape-determining protein MreC [Terracidiphilus sp.]|nr:rod shape-determining protein MreC [Terracidiphilus sp.]